MVSLATKTERDNIGIDTFSRAIAYSAFLLRKVYLENADNRIKSRITINPQVQIKKETNLTAISHLIIEAIFEFNSNILQTASDYFSSSLEVEGTAVYNGIILPESSDGIAPIEVEPVTVNTLEKYFLWAVFGLQKFILEQNQLNLFNSVAIDDRYNSITETHSQKVNIRVPFDYLIYLQTQSYLTAIGSPLILTSPVQNFDTIFIGDTVTVNSSENFVV